MNKILERMQQLQQQEEQQRRQRVRDHYLSKSVKEINPTEYQALLSNPSYLPVWSMSKDVHDLLLPDEVGCDSNYRYLAPWYFDDHA